MPYRDQLQDLYFAQAEPGAPVKIGISNHAERRIRDMRCVTTRRPMRALAIVRGTAKREHAIQRRFGAFALPINSDGTPRKPIASDGRPTAWRAFEWFQPAPELLAFVESLR